LMRRGKRGWEEGRKGGIAHRLLAIRLKRKALEADTPIVKTHESHTHMARHHNDIHAYHTSILAHIYHSHKAVGRPAPLGKPGEGEASYGKHIKDVTSCT
jgi:hypothetical protein